MKDLCPVLLVRITNKYRHRVHQGGEKKKIDMRKPFGKRKSSIC